MLFFKHAELAAQYHVSLKTVHNWIDEARQEKINLELYIHNGRTYVANNPSNIATLDRLVEERKKFRNTVHHKIIKPKEEFYTVFSRQQILDLITNLTVHREILRQYNYFDKGAEYWQGHVSGMLHDPGDNILKATVELLRVNMGTIARMTTGKKRINVIDIGPGEVTPSKELLEFLVDQNLLHKYIAIDVSSRMLEIAERRIKESFGNKVVFEGHIKDIRHERFDDLLVDDMLTVNAEDTLNIALFLSSTAYNFKDPATSFKTVCSSLGQNDILICSDKCDTAISRRWSNYNTKTTATGLPLIHRYVFDVLNLDESLYNVEMGFNEKTRMRYIQVRLKCALTISFKVDDGERSISFAKGDAILLLRVWHNSATEIIQGVEAAGFELLQASLSSDRQFMLTIMGVTAETL